MGHIAFEHNVTISQLRGRIFYLEDEIASWVLRCSQDASAAMTLAEENGVLAQANRELHESMQNLHERQRQQTTMRVCKTFTAQRLIWVLVLTTP
jgi:hypothetical protein